MTTPEPRARYGQVGGGDGAFIGAVHRMAARVDDECELVCGALSSEPNRAKTSGAALRLDTERAYGSWLDMLEAEHARPSAERMEFVNVVTPNHLHAEIASAALERGFHVLCDKPLCHSLEEALELLEVHRAARAQTDDRPPLFGVTYNYSGYPMVREARAIVGANRLGALRKILVEYQQGWLAQAIERESQKQASWRTDPARAGAAGAIGDIGTHAIHLAEFVTEHRLERVQADLGHCIEGRALDDDASVQLRFDRGVRGALLVSQIAVGRENGLRLRIFGERGSIEWFQEEPNSLVLDLESEARQTLRTGGPGLSDDATAATRLPAGHPEGFLGAFANLFRDFGVAVQRRRSDPAAAPHWTPTLKDGVRGMRFIDAVVRSDGSGGWVPVEPA